MGAEIYSSCHLSRQVMFVETAIYHSEVLCLFLQSILALFIWRPVSDFTGEISETEKQ